MVGALGNQIVFSTSDRRILNFNDFSQEISGNWATHNRIGMKPASEFLGAGLRSVSFTMQLNAQYGVRPRSVLTALERMVEEGETQTLVIGGRKVGKNRWKVTSISEAWNVILNRGELVSATVDVSLEEYL